MKNNPQTAHDLPATVIAEETELAEAFEANKAEAQFKGMEVSNKGKVFDLIVPILVLIVFSIWGMLYIGGFFEGVEFAAAVARIPLLACVLARSWHWSWLLPCTCLVACARSRAIWKALPKACAPWLGPL